MSRDNNWHFWEEDQPLGQAPQIGGGSMPQPGQDSNPQPQKPEPSNAQIEDPNQTKDDITQDPQHPDLTNQDDGGMEDKDFEEWKAEYFELAIKGETEELVKSLKQKIDQDLDPTQTKFVEDNMQIQLLRESSESIVKASKEIRKLMKENLDENYPATTTMQHICTALEKLPAINDIFYKLLGTGGGKGDYHRKFLAALLCAVQTGGGGSLEDIVYSEKDFSVNFSTRFSSEWGEIPLGRWSLKADDHQRYLEEPEIARLKDGAPEERTVLRHRIVLASIADQFHERGFLIHVANVSGTLHTLGWDVGDSIKSGYVDGKLVVRTKAGESVEAIIDDDGNIIQIPDLNVKFVKESGKTDAFGRPMKKEFPFLERKNGMLSFVGGINTIRSMSDAMSGVFFKEIPYSGNPSDIRKLIHCVPSINEILLRFPR